MAADTVLVAALDDVDRSLLEVSRTTGMLDPSKLFLQGRWLHRWRVCQPETTDGIILDVEAKK